MAQAKTLSDTELQRALDYTATTKAAVRNRAILLLTHWAGMRIGEVASVRYSDVLNADKQVLSEIHLAANQTKGSKSRVVLLSERMQQELAKYIAAHPPKDMNRPLFPTQRAFSTVCSVFMQRVLQLKMAATQEIKIDVYSQESKKKCSILKSCSGGSLVLA